MRVAGLIAITSIVLLSGLISKADGSPRTLDEVLHLIRQSDSRTIEDVLPHLGQELLSHYSLVHASRSPIEASVQKPRIILWNQTGDLMVSFAGDESMRNGRRLEIIEFDKNENRFRFGQVEFAKDRNVRPDIKEKDPQSCLGCHAKGSSALRLRAAEAAHPIWDTYPDWPGFYGSSHKPRLTKIYQLGTGALPKSPFIIKAFEEFKQNAGRNGTRYQALLGLQKKSLGDLSVLNSQFGNVILRTNLEKVHNILKRSERYDAFRKAFEKWTEPDNVFIKTLSPDDQKLYRERKPALEKEVDESHGRYYEDKAQRVSATEFPGEGRKLEVSRGPHLGSGKVSNLDVFEVQRGMRVRALFMLEQMKVPPELLSMSLENHPAAVIQGEVGLYQLGNLVMQDTLKMKAAQSAAQRKSLLNCILKFVKRP